MTTAPPPALRILILTCTTMLAAGSVLVHLGSTARAFAPLAAVLLFVLAWMAACAGAWRTARAGGVVGIGLLLGADLSAVHQVHPVRWPPWKAARIEGRIVDVRQHPLRMRVHGEVDRQDLPPIRPTTVSVRIRADDALRRSLQVGSVVVIDAMVRIPSPFHLPTEASEAASARAAGYSWSARADANDVHPLHDAPWSQSWLHRCRMQCRMAIDTLISADLAPIALALVTGDQSAIPAQQRAAYAAAGTAHMVSVSGSHVGLIMAVLVIALAPVRRPMLNAIIAMGCISLYVVFTGAEPPAVRAAIIGSLVIIGRARQRDVDALNLWSCAIMLMICSDATVITATSFVLSASATFGLIVLNRPLYIALERSTIRRRRWTRPVHRAVAVTLAATAAISIPSALYFDAVSVVSPVANLIVVPVMSAGMLFTIVALCCVPFSESMAHVYGNVAEQLLRCSDVITSWFAALQPAANGHRSIALAICLTMGIVWLAGCTTWHAMMRRAIITVITLTFIILVPLPVPTRSAGVLQRERCTVFIYPLPKDRTLVRIRPYGHVGGIHDIALQRYLTSLPHPVIQRLPPYASAHHHPGIRAFGRAQRRHAN